MWCKDTRTHNITEKEVTNSVNAKELKVQMIRKDKSVDDLCSACGISRSAWFRKINGESQFTQGEIADLRRELDLDNEATAAIFFDDEVS